MNKRQKKKAYKKKYGYNPPKKMLNKDIGTITDALCALGEAARRAIIILAEAFKAFATAVEERKENDHDIIN